MLASVASGLGGFFDKRWLLAFLFPVAAFCLAALLILADVSLFGKALQQMTEWPVELRALASFAGLATLIVAASLMSTLWPSITRLYEGYWRWGWLRNILVNRFRKIVVHLEQTEQYWTHEDAVAQLRDALIKKAPPAGDKQTWAILQAQTEATEIADAAAAERLMNYPAVEAVMPTRLGNILRTAETYPTERYGLDGVICWPRLMSVLPEEMRNRLAEAEVGMDLLLVVSFLSTLFGVVVVPVALYLNQDPRLCLYAGATFLIAGVAYVGSLSAARRFGELIKTSFDVYRFPMLTALQVNLPRDLQEDKAIGTDVSQFLYRGIDPLTATYATRPAEFQQSKEHPPADPLGTIISFLRELLFGSTDTFTATTTYENQQEARKRQLPERPAHRPKNWTASLWFFPLVLMAVPVFWRIDNVSPPSADAVEFAIKASPESTFNGTLKPGDSVNVVFVPKDTSAEPRSYLGIKVVQGPSLDEKGDPKGAIVLRVPGDKAKQFARDVATMSVLLARSADAAREDTTKTDIDPTQVPKDR